MANKLVTICGGKKKVWQNKQAATNFFLAGAMACDGSESERYLNVVANIQIGNNPATDEL